MSTLTRSALLGSVVAVAAAAYVLWPAEPQQAGPTGERLSLRQVMAPGDAAGFARALEPRELRFPEDHGPHPRFQIEWWYFTGNLLADSERFGYQLTFFRSALRPPPADSEAAPELEGDSAWRTEQLFMAHFALTDERTGRFHAFERFARQALGLAGASVQPFRVWLEDWSAQARAAPNLFPLALHAAEGGVSLDLTLEARKPAVLQGDAGLSRKGAGPGNASHYYSFTRLATRGTLELAGRSLRVEGSSWLDREWSTSALEPDVVGWDWFALRLSDGRDLMFYRLRRVDGSDSPYSAGTVVESDGDYSALGAGDVEISESRRWRSPETGVVYPSRWRLTSRLAAVDLEIEPLIEAQEHNSSVLYWEGAVTVSGQSAGEPIVGQGYVELTGYETDPKTP